MDYIVTMPLNPRHAQKAGFYSIFTYLKHLGALTGLQTVLTLNETTTQSSPQNKDLLLSNLQTLDCSTDRIWSDTQIQSEVISSLVRNMLSTRVLMETKVNIYHCSCFKVQYKAGSHLRKTKTSLLTEDGLSKCCKSKIVSTETTALVTRPCNRPRNVPDFQPHWASREFDWIYSQLEGQQLLLSRLNPRQFSVINENGDCIWLDNDVITMFFSILLKADRINVKQIVSGISTMRQVAILLMFSGWLGLDTCDVAYFLPRVSYISDSQNQEIGSLIERFGVICTTNTLLWCSLCEGQTANLRVENFQRITGSRVPAEEIGFTNRKKLLLY